MHAYVGVTAVELTGSYFHVNTQNARVTLSLKKKFCGQGTGMKWKLIFKQPHKRQRLSFPKHATQASWNKSSNHLEKKSY